jgi:flagellar basal body-associated protein FliL
VLISGACDNIHQLYSLVLMIMSWRCVLCPAGLLYLMVTMQSNESAPAAAIVAAVAVAAVYYSSGSSRSHTFRFSTGSKAVVIV